MDITRRRFIRDGRNTAIVFAFMFTLFSTTMTLFPTEAQARSTSIGQQFIKINSVKYRRAGAESAPLGAVGRKRATGTRPSRFERIHEWKSGIVTVRKSTIVRLSSAQVTSLRGSAFLTLSNGGRINGSGVLSNSTAGNFMLAKLEYSDLSHVIRKLNAHGSVKATLKREKKKGRVVTAVWILIRGSESQVSSLDLSGSYTSVQAGGRISINTTGTTVVSFSANTIMAYEMSKVKWKYKYGKRKSIKQLKADQVWP